VEARDFPLTLYWLRNSDIPRYLDDGVVDAAILGENTLLEARSQAEVVERLGFSRCRLSLAVPQEATFADPAWFEGKRIATSYPNSTAAYMKRIGVSASLHCISGSVEVAPKMGMADAVCDLVSSGSTLFANGLREVATVLESEAVLATNATAKPAGLDELRFRLQAVLAARHMRYILFNVPNESLADACRLLPGLRSPTVSALAEPGWSSVQSVIPASSAWSLIDALRQTGAEGMLVMPIEKCIA
jgi:ATP phosphoribosyltransferase